MTHLYNHAECISTLSKTNLNSDIDATAMNKKTHIDDSQRSSKIQNMLGEKLPGIIRYGSLLVLAIFIILAVIVLLIPMSDSGATIFDILTDK